MIEITRREFLEAQARIENALDNYERLPPGTTVDSAIGQIHALSILIAAKTGVGVVIDKPHLCDECKYQERQAFIAGEAAEVSCSIGKEPYEIYTRRDSYRNLTKENAEGRPTLHITECKCFVSKESE